jgi:hypothetical protein
MAHPLREILEELEGIVAIAVTIADGRGARTEDRTVVLEVEATESTTASTEGACDRTIAASTATACSRSLRSSA